LWGLYRISLFWVFVDISIWFTPIRIPTLAVVVTWL
jgi:hypothetical protein